MCTIGKSEEIDISAVSEIEKLHICAVGYCKHVCISEEWRSVRQFSGGIVKKHVSV